MRSASFRTGGARRTAPEKDPGQRSRRPDLGVLFVHGIGNQREGDTVASWGDALISWLRDWLEHGSGEKPEPGSLRVMERGPVQVTDARLQAEPGSLGPPYVDVELDLPGPGSGDEAEHQTWRLAEAWWAEAFHPPRFSDLAFWGFAVLPWALVAHFVTRLEGAWRWGRSGRATVARVAGLTWRIFVEVLLVIMAILLSPVLASLVLVMLLLAALPVRPLRQAAAGLQRMLSLTVGDSYVLLGSPSRAASIISRVEENLQAMTDCRALAVVAHSQGAVVAYEALKRTRPRNLRKFVTFGSGHTKLVALKRLQRSKANRLVWLAPLGLLALMSFAWYGIGQIRAGDSDSVFTLIFLAVFALVMVTSGLLATRTLYEPTREDLDVGAKEGWLDLYATHDPVPNGPLFGIREKRDDVNSCPVQNAASVLFDHTSYWRNRDEFVPAVAIALAEAGDRSIDRPDSSDEATRYLARARRRWRILCLRSLRLLAVVTLVAIVIGYGDRLPRLGRWLINVGIALVDLVPLVSWQPGGIRAGGGIDPVVGTAAVVVAVALAYATVTSIWRLWERADFGRFVRRERYPLWSPEFVVGLYATAALLGLAWAGPALRWPSVDLSLLVALFLAPIFVLLLAFLTFLVAGPLGWLLLKVGIIRPGHFPPSAGEWAATAIPLYLLVLGLAALLGTKSTPAVAAFLYGPPILAWLGPPLLSSSRLVHRLLRPLRRLAATELGLWAADRLDGRGDVGEILLDANRLQDEIERRLDELKKQVGAGSQKDVERLILVPSIWSSKLRRIIGDLTDQAEELATILQQNGRGDAACALLSAAAAYSPTAAIRLWELDPSFPGAYASIKRHAREGSPLSRIRVRRALGGIEAPTAPSTAQPRVDQHRTSDPP